MSRGYLGIGGNVGDRRATLQQAVDVLPAAAVRVRVSSSVYATAAVGGPAGQPDFLNACLEIETDLSPPALLEALKAVEAQAGRAAEGTPGYVHHGPRPLDLDILLLGEEVYADDRLRIPHAALLDRRFVLVPLLELAFDLALPDDERPAAALAALPVGEDVRRSGPPLSCGSRPGPR